MVRTISEIKGEFGLSDDASKDPFKETEEAVLKTVQDTLAEVRSVDEERLAAKGLGRSTFHFAAQKQQEEGILSDINQQFAQARLQENLRERQFERGIVERGVAADIGEEAAQAEFGRTTDLLTQQTEKQKEIAEFSTEQSKELLAEQQRLSEQTATAGLERQKEISEFQQELGEETAEAALGRQEQLAGTQAELAERQLRTQGEVQRLNIDRQHQNDLASLQEQSRIKMENLPEELRLTAAKELQLLTQELDIKREIEYGKIALQETVAMNQQYLNMGQTMIDEIVKNPSPENIAKVIGTNAAAIAIIEGLYDTRVSPVLSSARPAVEVT